MNNHIAQAQSGSSFSFPLGQPLNGLGPLGNPGSNAPTLFNNFFSGIIAVLTGVAAIWFIFNFLTGALGIIGSGGDKGAYETARKKMTSGIVGLVLVIASIFIVDIVGKLLGLDFILDPGKFIDTGLKF